MTMRSPLGRVRGLGSAKEGTDHWFTERLTALALVPLSLWFVAAVLGGVGADHATLKAWMSVPGNMTLMILLITAFFWHAALALGTVIEDYVHHKPAHMGGLIAVKFGCIFLGVFSIVSVLKIGMGG
jgi:succinate dehydrogenase / fumarate reductase membrane anchor subunit